VGESLTWTIAQLATIEAAYALGALSVKHGDKLTVFRSRKEMRAMIVEARVSLGLASARQISYTKFDKGYS